MAKLRAIFDRLGYLIGLLRRYAPLESMLLVFGGVVSGFATPIIVWGIAGLVDTISHDGSTDIWPRVLPWLATFSVAMLLRSAYAESSRYLASTIYRRVGGRMQRAVACKSVLVPLSAFDSRTYYEKLETGKQAIGRHFVDVLFEFGSLVAITVGATGLIVLFFKAHWALALVLVVTLIVNSILGAKNMGRFVQVNYKRSAQRQEVDYWTDVLTSRHVATEIRAYQLGEYFLGLWRRAFDRYFADVSLARYQLARARLIRACLHDLIIWTNGLVVVIVALTGSISLGAMVALLYASNRFSELVQSASFSVSQLAQHLMQLQHLREFLEMADEGSDRANVIQSPRQLEHGIRFHGVGFTYPGSRRPAITDLDLTIAPGDRVAIVGENGAGKSTVIRLLLGLYQPTQGRITVDGIDLAELDSASWRQMATAVFQDFMRYPVTVKENIGFGQVSLLRKVDRGSAVCLEIVDAARRSGAHSFVRDLPSAYETELSKEFAGVELSFGQWQRLAMARAYVRKNCEVVVLDEPTSALDPKTELQVYQQFRSAAEGRCTVFISHRLGSARLANRILVLREGRLVEEGSHDLLCKARGEYARMYRLQANWYSENVEGTFG